jgi:hypothetical protein
MIEQTIYDALQDASITAITSTRIYPVRLPDEANLPAIEYSIIGGAVSPTQDTHGTQRLRLEVNCWGATYADAVNLRYAIIQALDGYKQVGVLIKYLMPQDIFDHDLEQYRAIAEFYVYASV